MISRALCKNQDPGEELGELEEQRERERESEQEIWGGCSKHKGLPRRSDVSRAVQPPSMRALGAWEGKL